MYVALFSLGTVCNATTPRNTRELTKAVDALCDWTGLKRSEPLRSIKASKERAYPYISASIEGQCLLKGGNLASLIVSGIQDRSPAGVDKRHIHARA